MLSVFWSMTILLIWVAGSLLTLLAVHLLWPQAERRAHNDIVGFQIGTIGVTYAVLLGFMLYNVWDNFRSAEVNVAQEANSLVSIYRFADGLPDATRQEVQQDARRYAQIMIQEEWPEMAQRSFSPAGFAVTQDLWKTLVKAGKDPAAQEADLKQAIEELSSLTQHRRVREIESETYLPGLLWMVLLVGGIITIFSSCLLACENFRLHFVLVLCLSLLLGITLLAIAEIDRPYQGPVHVHARAFERAARAFDGAP
jgi:Protein of unknown function (DUF4239)